ncbi:ABC-type transport auxiliary lipoprotein family protein [Pseudodesulfovibrio sp.]|uniref:ABC-type transport auxiliary lipoprotein family protein n=1 Tax=unclassified Pseudodesulfovibrio TaxID=2661612 RepID=UPI003B007782
MKRTLNLILIMALAIAATACVKLGGKPLDKTYYRIHPARTETARTNSGIILKLRRMTVSDLYNMRELVYQMSDGRIESDYYNTFFVAPGNMLTSELRTWLDGSGLFKDIIEPGSMVIPDLTLEGTVNTLYGDYSQSTPAAVVGMQFFLVDESTATNEIIFSKDYRRRVPLIQPDPTALVQAMTKAVGSIFTELEEDLAKVPAMAKK